MMGLHMVQDTVEKDEEYTDFKFSASYANRYHNCHGSANLKTAIPGFEFPERNNKGMKGIGTRLHEIGEVALSSPERIRDSAQLLREISQYWGIERQSILKDEMRYLISWFKEHKSEPPLEASFLYDKLVEEVPDDDKIIFNMVQPRRIVFVADALDYVADLMDNMDSDSLVLMTEATSRVNWLMTTPNTTVDILLKDKNEMHIIDLKMGDVEVYADHNDQLLYYARTFGYEEYDTVTLHILQRNNINSWETTRSYIDTWTSTIRESELAIMGGDTSMRPGEHCKFCPANPRGRGDKGNKSCPVLLSVIYGSKEDTKSDIAVLEGDLDD